MERTSNMKIYKVWIQIEQVDKETNSPLKVGAPYEAGKFGTEAEAVRFVEKQLLTVRPVKLALQTICQAGLKFLDSLPTTELTTELQNRDAFRNMLNSALSQNAPIVDDSCPKCGAKMIEEFRLADVFIDDQAG